MLLCSGTWPSGISSKLEKDSLGAGVGKNILKARLKELGVDSFTLLEKNPNKVMT